MEVSRISRRSLLQAAAALIPSLSHAAAPARLAVIDWALFETCIALGAAPAAATELVQFRKIVVEPAVPDSVIDIGLRGTPNLELLSIVAPDLVLISNFYEYQRPSLERIAPVLSLTVYEAGKPSYPFAEQAALALGDRLARPTEAALYVKESAALLAQAGSALAEHRERPIFVVSLGDSRHFRAFGADSLFGDVLTRLGLTNAWTDTTSYSAAAPVGLEALARVPESSIAIVEPLPPEVGRNLPDNALWHALPAVKAGRVSIIPPINHFGGLPSARRFARLLTEALTGTANG